MFSLFERYAPSDLIWCVVAGVGTFIGGLTFIGLFVAGWGLANLGHFLDTYGVD